MYVQSIHVDGNKPMPVSKVVKNIFVRSIRKSKTFKNCKAGFALSSRGCR